MAKPGETPAPKAPAGGKPAPRPQQPGRGKGGHIRVELAGRKSIVPTGSGEIRRGTLFTILRDLGLRLEDLR